MKKVSTLSLFNIPIFYYSRYDMFSKNITKSENKILDRFLLFLKNIEFSQNI